MKVSVRNLGVIKEAQIDLKPLTVFIGPNNAGKTWLAYTLAGILGPYGLKEYTSAYINRNVLDIYPLLDETIKQVLDKGSAKIDLVRFADEFVEAYFNNVAKFAPQWMNKFLGTVRVDFNQLEISFELEKTKSHLLGEISHIVLQSDVAIGARNQGSSLTMRKKQGDNNLFILTSTEGQPSEALPDEIISERIVRTIFRVIHEAYYPYVRIFPTERTAFLSLFPYSMLGQGLVELFSRLILRTDEKSRQEDSGAFETPITDFIYMIGLLFESSTSDREKELKNNAAIANYLQLAQLLEKQILGGNTDFSTPEPDTRREIHFQPTENVTLDLSVASSMVKELAPLVLYLRYLAQPGEWLIIDEPEMNLHPEAQAKLTEFLAMLVNAGLPVLITTHSPYIVDHLSNLMKAAESTEPEAIQDKFYLQNKDAFISKNDVSVYLVDEGKTVNMLDEDGVVHWSTFGTVSDRVSEIFFEL